MKFYAHSDPEHPHDYEKWEPLFTRHGDLSDQCQEADCQACAQMERFHGHLNKVAYWTALFAEDMFSPRSPTSAVARQWGHLAGMWHDLGKFAPQWQEYLKAKVADVHTDEVSGKMDHATAGAVFSSRKKFGDLMAYLIAGHHSGLPDGPQLFQERLKKAIPNWESTAHEAGLLDDGPVPMPPLTRKDAGCADLAFMMRMFYSCLVDADFLATESFMDQSKRDLRPDWSTTVLREMLGVLQRHYDNAFSTATGAVNAAREMVRNACYTAGYNPPGFYSLTVPTGGGKTLASLLFALKHAQQHGLRRVIYVIPFTSIIKQNADVFRKVFEPLSKALGKEIVLEHHSKFDPNQETVESRLTAENWDAPLIVTTNVQFFESLYANRSRGCRKLHRLARSVVIFDEVQALPLELLAPIIRGMRSLVRDFGSSLVLCTATQPALENRADFHIGIPAEEITEIIPHCGELFDALKRTASHNLGALSDAELIAHVMTRASEGCLIIVNTTKAAQTLHAAISQQTTALHLSARMCPAHVIAVLDEAKQLRQAGKPVVLVSTQIIEAGVDISFPTVYRAECGLDSFAQAAGRCNRNGELRNLDGSPICGNVFYFQPTDHPIPKGLSDLRAAAQVTRSGILPVFAEHDLLSLEAIRSYFEQAIWQSGPKTEQWDKHHIVSGDMPCFPNDMKSFQYKSAAEKFRLIPSITHPVIIPWGDEGKDFAAELRHRAKLNITPHRDLFRQAQQFTVQVYANEWQHLQNRIEPLNDGTFALLIHPENDYHDQTGLKRPNAPEDPSAFCV